MEEFIEQIRETYKVIVDYENLKIGDVVLGINNVLLSKDGDFLCRLHSQDGITYFAPDFDGRGMERGKLTHFLAHRPLNEGNRYTVEECIFIVENYPEFISKEHWEEIGVLLFNDDFYRGDIDKLKQLIEDLGKTKEAEEYVPHNE